MKPSRDDRLNTCFARSIRPGCRAACWSRRDRLEAKVDLLQHATSSEALSLFPDFQQRLGVLRR